MNLENIARKHRRRPPGQRAFWAPKRRSLFARCLRAQTAPLARPPFRLGRRRPREPVARLAWASELRVGSPIQSHFSPTRPCGGGRNEKSVAPNNGRRRRAGDECKSAARQRQRKPTRPPAPLKAPQRAPPKSGRAQRCPARNQTAWAAQADRRLVAHLSNWMGAGAR